VKPSGSFYPVDFCRFSRSFEPLNGDLAARLDKVSGTVSIKESGR